MIENFPIKNYMTLKKHRCWYSSQLVEEYSNFSTLREQNFQNVVQFYSLRGLPRLPGFPSVARELLFAEGGRPRPRFSPEDAFWAPLPRPPPETFPPRFLFWLFPLASSSLLSLSSSTSSSPSSLSSSPSESDDSFPFFLFFELSEALAAPLLEDFLATTGWLSGSSLPETSELASQTTRLKFSKPAYAIQGQLTTVNTNLRNYQKQLGSKTILEYEVFNSPGMNRKIKLYSYYLVFFFWKKWSLLSKDQG